MKLALIKIKSMVTLRVIMVCLILSSHIYGADTRFTLGQSALAIPFELGDRYNSNHIYLKLSINDSAPLSFVLDTGASHTILSLRHAMSFGMQLELLGKATDATGSKPPDAYLVKDKVSFSLPGVVVSDQMLVAMSLDMTQECISRTSEQKTRRAVDGILGANFFSNFVVEIDYTARLINLYEPHSYKYAGKGKSLPLEMDSNYIFVRVRVKTLRQPSVPARLIVDTGSGSALALTRQFTTANKLLPPAKKLMQFIDCGAGGNASEKSWVTTLEILQLGSFKLSNPATIFYQKEIQGSDGLLGNLALRNFKVIFDYSRSRMILESPHRVGRSR